jgi:alpha-beta hydrolase superfamily lysophospholipase
VLEGWLAAPQLPSDPIDVATLSQDPTVGEAYAEDPLVWHGGWKRATLQALVAAENNILEGPSLAGLPLLCIHGQDDTLVPLDRARPVVERVFGSDREMYVLADTRHEVFNERDKAETIGIVADFVERVTAVG